MTIPGRGDLAPRRRRRNPRRRAAVVLVVLVAGGLGYGGYRYFSAGSPTPRAVLLPCPSGTPSQPSALERRLVVRNATLTTGLAAQVARDLRQRHFRVGGVGNTLFRGKGVATVRYSADRLESAQLVAAQFAGATMVPVSGSDVLEVDIGPRYTSLVPTAQAQAADQQILASASPSPTVTPSPTCAPRSSTTTP